MGHRANWEKRVAEKGQPIEVPKHTPSLTPVQQHMARTQPVVTPAGSNTPVAQLEAYRAQLSGKAEAEKMAIKKEALSVFGPYLKAFFAAGKSANDQLVAWCMIWLWDVGDIEAFVSQSQQAEKMGVKSPIATPLDEFRQRRVREWAEEQVFAGQSPEPYLSQVFDAEQEQMGEHIRGMFHRVLGLDLERQMETAPPEKKVELGKAAQYHYEKAVELNPKPGVKTRMEKLANWFKKLPTAVVGQPAGEATGSTGPAVAPATDAPNSGLSSENTDAQE